MTKAKKRKRQRSYDRAKLIGKIEKAASTAMAIYAAVEPIFKAIVANGRKTK